MADNVRGRDRIRSWEGEVCKVCGQPNHFGYNLPDELWRSIVPEEFWEGGIVCLGCLDWFAWQKGIEYLRHLDELYYVGRDETVTMHVIRIEGVDYGGQTVNS